ncbi:hypothetical protein AAVH_33503, partial [Aphelenchoides avenae]
ANNRPRLLNELFVEVMLFMDRDSLDSIQLACRFMLAYIREHEANELALRRIAAVSLGDVRFAEDVNADDEEYWLPVMRLIRYDEDEKLVFTCVHGLVPYLRMVFCKAVYVTLETIQSAGATNYEIACGMLFADLNARSTDVDSLRVCSDQGATDLLNRCINAFKSVRHLHMTATSDELFEPHAFNEVFFASLAHRGITCFDAKLDLNQAGILEINAGTAFAYVFAEPMNGVSRELRGVKFVEKDILELIRKKAGELDSRQRVDLKATIDTVFYDYDIDFAVFEKYESGEGRWAFNDLDNGLILEIEDNAVESILSIRVYSSPSFEFVVPSAK